MQTHPPTQCHVFGPLRAFEDTARRNVIQFD